jgi:DNA-binding Lrp family transcriptional regulator
MVDKKLNGEIEEYCKLNEVDVAETLNEALRSGFTILQYGMGPNKTKVIEKVVEVIKEVPIEKIVEVTVEKIVERIVEVPVEKIIEVEKSININVDGHNVSYKDYIEELNKDISKLEVSKKQIMKELKDSKIEVDRLTEIVTSSELQVEKLKKDLKNSKNAGGYDMYGEK